MDEEKQWLQEDDWKSGLRAVRVREAIELFPILQGGLIHWAARDHDRFG